MTLDPAALQVLISRLTGVAEEMGAVLQRAAFSPNIKERADCSSALFTPAGELLVQAEHIPVHLGSMPASVAAVIAAVDVGSMCPGDQFVVNDPFAGGTHLNDITIVAPCLVPVAGGHRLVGWAANRAHHADVGGSAPGSMPADAREIFEEGLRLPPLRLTDEVRAVLLANSRTPDERAGDLDAQVGANILGVRRLAESVDEPIDEVIAYGERRMRAALAALPDGEWTAEDVLDSTGSHAEQQVASRIRLRLRLAGDQLEVDFTGTDPQSAGNVNAVAAVTESAVGFAVRSVVDPTIPANGGAMRPVRIHLPRGSIVAAEPPAAVGAGNVEVSQRVADVVLAALAAAAPERVAAGNQGTMNNLLIGGRGWVYYETVGGGQGGRMSNGTPAPGQSGIQTGMTNTKNTPIEALERHFPLRVLRYRLRRGSGGAGLAPGGEGIERELEVLEDVTVSLITERRVSRPNGLAGGEPGATGENWLLPQGDEARAERLPDKVTRRLAAGDVVRMLTPGGGGWGAPPHALSVEPEAPGRRRGEPLRSTTTAARVVQTAVMWRLSPESGVPDALAPYADVERRPVNGRPWVLANMVSGLDGSTAIDGRVGALSSPTDRQLFVDLRSVADIVLVGAETVRRERYGPVVLSPERRRSREDRGRPPLPRLAVVSRSLSFDLGAKLFRPVPDRLPPIVLTCEASPPGARTRLGEVAEVIVAGSDRVEPVLALQALAGAGHEVVLCEGGPSLLGELLAQDLVDELCLTLAPMVGGDPLPVAVMPSSAATSAFRLVHVLEADGNLFLRYERR